jgi:cytochrome c-type biogenesis protein
MEVIMKKITILVLFALVMSLSLVGCSSKSNVSTLDVSSEETPVESEASGSTDGAESTSEQSETETASSEQSETETASSEESELQLPVSLPDGRGGELEFADYKGKMLFVNFFGTWCTYCMQEMPDFQKFTDNYSDEATIVIVNALETENIDMQGVVDWYNESGYTMPMAIDEDQSKTIEFYGAISGFPTISRIYTWNDGLYFVGTNYERLLYEIIKHSCI